MAIQLRQLVSSVLAMCAFAIYPILCLPLSTDRDQQFVIAHIVLVVSLVVALLVFSEVKYRSPKWAMPAIKAMGWIGIALSIRSAAILHHDQLTRVSINKPIRFDREGMLRAEFEPAFELRHNVELVLAKTIDFTQVDAFAGSPFNESTPSPFPRPEIEWNVKGGSITQEEHGWNASSWSQDCIDVNLGHFTPEVGKKCILEVRVKKPSPKAQILEPKINIELTYAAWGASYIPGMFASMASLIAFIIGVSFSVSALRQRRRS